MAFFERDDTRAVAGAPGASNGGAPRYQFSPSYRSAPGATISPTSSRAQKASVSCPSSHSTHLPSSSIRKLLMAIHDTQRHSEALGGHSESLKSILTSVGSNQRQSEAIRRAFSQVSEAISERLGPVAKFGHVHCMHCPTHIVLPHAAQPDGGGDAEQA
jgi:hypothetical protein